MRLFVAIDIDDGTRAQLALARAAIQDVLSNARVSPRITWVKDECAHVTIRFIGETSAAVATKIQDVFTTSWPMAAFDVRWEHIGAFPGVRRPRFVWIGPRAADDLVRLAALVEARLAPLIGAGEARAFNPHITLGRVRDGGTGVDWPRALAAHVWSPTTTRIDHLTLYLSELSPKGPTYTALCKAPL